MDSYVNYDDRSFEFVHQSWPAHPTALRPIRDEVDRWLMPLQLDSDTHADLVYAVSEAATNAVEHAYRPPTAESVVELSFWTEPSPEASTLHIEIVDHGTWRVPQPDVIGRGRGIPMMHRLTESVTIYFDDRGTRVLLSHPLEEAVQEPTRR